MKRTLLALIPVTFALMLLSFATAGGSSPGTLDAIAIDMDPTGNTATSISPREFCARLNNNGVQDADEDFVDGLEIDVTTGPAGIPADAPMIGFEFKLHYPGDSIEIISEDAAFLLVSAPGSDPFPFIASDPLPESDGSFLSAAGDLSGAGAESGPGVLSRISLRSRSSAETGIHHLVLSDVGYVNADGQGLGADDVKGAVLAIDSECPVVQPTPGPPTRGPTPTRSIAPPPSRTPPTTAPSQTLAPTSTAAATETPVPTAIPLAVTAATAAQLPRTGGATADGDASVWPIAALSAATIVVAGSVLAAARLRRR